MKLNKFFYVPALLLLMLASTTACKDTPNPVEKYGDAMIDSYKGAQQGGEQAHLLLLQKAIRTFHTMHGRYPEDLAELETFIGSDINDTLFAYDSSTGTLTAIK